MSLFFAVLIFTLFICHSVAGAELETGKPDSGRRTLVTTFAKGLEYDGWDGALHLSLPMPSDGWISIHENISVRLYRISGFHRQWRLDQRFDFRYEQQSEGWFKWLLAGEQERFSDQRAHRYADDVNYARFYPAGPRLSDIIGVSAGGGGGISSQHLALGAGYARPTDFSAWGSLGPIFEDRRGEKNSGVRLDLNLLGNWRGNNLRADGWLNRLNVGNDFGWSASISGEHAFSGEAGDMYTVSYRENGQREFSVSEESEGRRRDERLNISNRLSGGGDSPFRMVWDSEFSRQRIEHSGLPREYTDHEFLLENDVKVVYGGGGFRGAVTGGLDLQEQQYEDALIQGRRSYMGIYAALLSSFLDSSAVEARVINYRFNTPDENDLNDRDELRYLLVLRAGKKLLPGLGARVKMEADLHHLVYIFRPRSAENRWSRMFSLSCELPWEEGSVKNISRFSMVGNYNVYDYTPADVELSRVYRFFSVDDTLQIQVHPRWELMLGTELLVDEHGRFRWDDWVEDISENGYSLTTSFMTYYNVHGLRAGFGWKTHHRYSWLHVEGDDRMRGDAVRSQGPALYLRADPAERLNVVLNGQVLHVNDSRRGNFDLPDVRCSLTWML